jgi:galactofuranosylgalactofuranosylrhamnosyl-N-acetylglucosaminyl-diphospho-decaprenol beta-1,5/1,6-galactofuranosyltransferase
MSAADSTPVWRVVFPSADDAQILPLYIDGDASDAAVEGRRRLRIRPGGSVSLGSYFNAFPASVWRAETNASEVVLRVRAEGRGVIRVVFSDGGARSRQAAAFDVVGEMDAELRVSLTDFTGGGNAWIDLAAAADAPLTLVEAHWELERTLSERAVVVMATFNRPDDCLAQLRALGKDAHVWEVVERVIVVDQGTDRVDARAEFEAIAGLLGDRLRIIRQPNLGGSGGFSRGMLEVLRDAREGFVLLLDDDARTEPETIGRVVRFADAAREPLVVGGGMLHLDDRARLYVQGELWDHHRGWIDLNRPGAYDHDFARVGMRAAAQFHSPQRSDFAGWWMCLIPRALLESVGLAMPLFLKGDDVEFGLRAGRAGVRTVSVPGIALWHMGWGGKSPTRTWEAYFLHRNRVITELLHSPYRRANGLILQSFLGDLKPLLSANYAAVRLRAQALSDVLAGPESLPEWLSTRAAQVRRLWGGFPEATPVDAPVLVAPARARPKSAPSAFALLLRTVARQFFVRERFSAVPEVHSTAAGLGWWVFADADSAVVDLPDGSGRVIHRRSRASSRTALQRSLRLHARLWWRWPALSRAFRNERATLTSPASWADVFGT